MKARNSYKHLLACLEKVIEIRCYKDKTSSFTSIKLNALNMSGNTTGGSDKMHNAQQLIVNKEKEIELD